MSKANAYDRYRRIFTSGEDGLTTWWYLGTTICNVPAVPPIPVIQAETVMVYRTESLSPEACRIHWWEIGYFRDVLSGEIASHWRNPLTGVDSPCPRQFEEGPAYYTVRAVDDGVSIELSQPHAIVQGVEATLTEAQGQSRLLQTERKSRGYPLPDGRIPDPASGLVSQAVTQLCMSALDADLASDVPSVDSSGCYSFTLSALPQWMGFGDAATGTATTFGQMRKTAMNAALNATGWARLQQVFPDRFVDGQIQPRW